MVFSLQAEEGDIAPYVERVHDAALGHALGYGVAFLHETQAPGEQDVAKLLFSSGAVQVGAVLSWACFNTLFLAFWCLVWKHEWERQVATGLAVHMPAYH